MVIAIIAILASLLLPALRQAREKASGAVCHGNLRQICLAQQMYGQDNDEVVVEAHYSNSGTAWDGGYFDDRLDAYLNTEDIWYCPSRPQRTPRERGYYNQYGMPCGFYRQTRPTALLGCNGVMVKAVQIRHPEATPLNAESAQGMTGPVFGDPDPSRGLYRTAATFLDWPPPIYPHINQRSILHFDGHVLSYAVRTESKLKCWTTPPRNTP
ncbi:MAG: hypothetical protein A3K18_26750 [Lentisphaerae bacterium RIFOXYA12_64_32]|nr:MAG: hypothetical protein A3K18_26750 [Lentisphaerae bacterium RIFOXYA12_64_32]